VFDLAISTFNSANPNYKDCSIYRCRRIPDLYGHPAAAVADLSVTVQEGMPFLEFSADDVHAYVIEASTNMTDWQQIGVSVEDPENPGDFAFHDASSDGLPTRYYRVVTR
jgi:hypothetical protein